MLENITLVHLNLGLDKADKFSSIKVVDDNWL